MVQLLSLEEQGKGEVFAAFTFLVSNSIDLANVLEKDASLFIELILHSWQLHMVLLELSFYVDRFDDEASGIALNHHEFVDVLLLVDRPQFVESDQQVFEYRKVIDKTLIVGVQNLEVPLVEGRYEPSQLDEMAVQGSATVDNMLREHILLPIDPEVIESFLATVEDLWEVGSL